MVGRLIHTVGEYAKNPYEIEKLGMRVFCVEELCFLLCENTYIPDEEIVDKKMADWLDKECHLKELSVKLMSLIVRRGSGELRVGAILDYVSYADEEKREEVKKLFRENIGLDDITKRKKYASYLLKKNRYGLALDEYDLLLQENLQESEEAVLLHNKGVALAGLFDFERAETLFFQALQKDPNNKELEEHYLVAVRMSRTPEEYRIFLEKNPLWHDTAKVLEEKWTELENNFCYKPLSSMERADKLHVLRQEYREMVKK